MLTADIQKLQETLATDLVQFLPELLLCVAIVGMLLLRLLPRLRLHMGWVSLGVSLFALGIVAGAFWDLKFRLGGVEYPLNLLGNVDGRNWIFNRLLVIDNFTMFLRLILLAFAALISWLAMQTGIPDEEDSADFFTLLLGGTLGMMLMASANHLMMIFIAVEMASLPCYALAGFLKGRRQSSEASLKYVVYGGGASGVMLYGMSLLSGRFGTGYLPDLTLAIRAQMTEGTTGTLVGMDAVVLLGLVFLLVGLGFKLSAVPFHFWAPDVFEGAAAEVGAFLSVASKAAALALTARFLMAVTNSIAFQEPSVAVQRTLGPAIAFFAALTATFGNLAAYPQTNLKRLLAYSTIAHAGYMLMGLAPLNSQGVGAVLFYLVAYLLMNLGAFAVVAFIRNRIGSEDLRDMRGLVYRSPWTVVMLGVFMLSLLGLPPLAGFAAKFQVFAVLFDAGREYTAQARSAGQNPALGYTMYALLFIGGINTVISAVYYLRVMKVMILDRPVEEVEGHSPAPLSLPVGAMIYAGMLAALVFIGGILWNPIALAGEKGVSDFQFVPAPKEPPAGGPQLGPAPGGGPRPGGAVNVPGGPGNE